VLATTASSFDKRIIQNQNNHTRAEIKDGLARGFTVVTAKRRKHAVSLVVCAFVIPLRLLFRRSVSCAVFDFRLIVFQRKSNARND
jgi:hypothetical protein